MSTGVIIGIITAIVLILLRRFALPPLVDTVGFSTEELEDLKRNLKNMLPCRVTFGEQEEMGGRIHLIVGGRASTDSEVLRCCA